MRNPPFEELSSAQKMLKRMGLKSWAWSLRRLHCPVGPEALVLEVGSGGNPLPRANVLVDAYVSTRERHWAPLRTDRPTVLAVGENLPFKDKTFDFVIACHVLEHSSDPDQFLSELQRVGKAGYIETPDAFMERINPYRDHRLEVTVRDGELVIRKKAAWVAEPETVELYEHRVKRLLTRKVMPRDPDEFHMRYYWRDRIQWRVVNPNTDAGWSPPASETRDEYKQNSIRRALTESMQWLYSQKKRNASLDVLSLLRCPSCLKGDLRRERDDMSCSSCAKGFPSEGGIPCLMPRP